MSRKTWLLSPDGDLCMQGYPIYVRKIIGAPWPFETVCEGYPRSPHFSLSVAKMDGEARAKEMDELRPRVGFWARNFGIGVVSPDRDCLPSDRRYGLIRMAITNIAILLAGRKGFK